MKDIEVVRDLPNGREELRTAYCEDHEVVKAVEELINDGWEIISVEDQ